MKKLPFSCLLRNFLLLTFIFFGYQSKAANYYFSSSMGNDSRSISEAQNIASPWKTISKLNSFFNSLNYGDVIYLKRGDVFEGSLIVSKSGITITAYGEGIKPEITGFKTLSGWYNTGNNIWETTINEATPIVNSVSVNGNFKPVGRYPNASAANKGFLKYESYNGKTSITDSKIASAGNFTGGEIIIRKTRWVLDKNKILQHAGNVINYQSQSNYDAAKDYGYFIQNHPATLDVNGEWFFNSTTKKFGIYSGSDNPNNFEIKAGIIETLIDINGQGNIVFDQIKFTGAVTNTIRINSSQNIRISNCEILFSGKNAIDVSNSNTITIENSTIDETNNIAFNINASGTIIKNNIIKNTGTHPGMGDGDSGSYEAILISGDNNLIENNQIENTGYVPLTFNGNNITIKNNFINNFAFVKDDGGAIYTWNNGANAPANYGRVVSNNIILNGKGAPDGTDNTQQSLAHGIYIDDNAANVEIIGNSIADCASYGIFIHNAHDIIIKQNTSFNNLVQLVAEHDNIAPNSPVYNLSVTDNIFFSKKADQIVAEYKTKNNDIRNFGSFDRNIYSRPFDDQLVIKVLQQVNGTYTYKNISLETWKSTYGKDASSKNSAKEIIPFKINKTVGKNKFSNDAFNDNINSLYAYAAAGNANTVWANGILDGGSLKISFSSVSGKSDYASLVLGIGAVEINKTYLLKFSMLGVKDNKVITAYLRQSVGSYKDLSIRKSIIIEGKRTEQQILFTATSPEDNASIVFDVDEQNNPLYLDNIQLTEVEASLVNPNDVIKFFYNASGNAKTINIGSMAVDVNNIVYDNTIKLAPYASSILITDNIIDKPPVITPPAVTPCENTGNMMIEQWTNIQGNDVSNIPLQTSPSVSKVIDKFEVAQTDEDNYGSRIRGYICAPISGNYTFMVAGDDAIELYLSTSANAAEKKKIAYSLSWTNYQEFNKYPSQKSALIYLEAGTRYYIEALHKEGNGGNHFSVAWQLPNGQIETPISGSHLSPFIISKENQTIDFQLVSTKVFTNEPFSINAVTSSGLPVSFRILSGPAVMNGNLLTMTGSGTVTIEASQIGNSSFNTAVSVTKSFDVTEPVNSSKCTATGFITREVWLNADGNNIADIPISKLPDNSNLINKFEGTRNEADRYASRIRGYICAPQTGLYTFWVSGDDATELWLSTDDKTANKIKIAYQDSWAAYNQWNMHSSQKSAGIYLQAGSKYYVEALQKEGGGDDHLAVQWQLPDGSFESPIAGKHLSPFQSVTAPENPNTCAATGGISWEYWSNVYGHSIASTPFNLPSTGSSKLNNFTITANRADLYGDRARGYVCAPKSGYYTFYIASDDQGELWLSSNEDPANKRKIAYTESWTNPEEYNRYATQESQTIYLEAGKHYYIESLHNEGNGGDHLSVGWKLPDGTLERPILGAHLVPFPTSQSLSSLNNKSQLAFIETKTTFTVYPNPFSTNATVEFNNTYPESNTAIKLYDLQGKLLLNLYTGQTDEGMQHIPINAEGLTAGFYIIKLINGQNVLSKKILISNK